MNEQDTTFKSVPGFSLLDPWDVHMGMLVNDLLQVEFCKDIQNHLIKQ